MKNWFVVNVTETVYASTSQWEWKKKTNQKTKKKDQLNFSSIHLPFGFIFDHFLCLQNKMQFSKWVALRMANWMQQKSSSLLRCMVWSKKEIYEKKNCVVSPEISFRLPNELHIPNHQTISTMQNRWMCSDDCNRISKMCETIFLFFFGGYKQRRSCDDP